LDVLELRELADTHVCELLILAVEPEFHVLALALAEFLAVPDDLLLTI
jgi:hypothetical protein